MKKIFLSAICLWLCLLLAGCGSTVLPASSVQSETAGQQSAKPASSPASSAADESAPAQLLSPEIIWWELYNPNGFDTLTAAFANPNPVAIDASYDVVFYKDGTEVSRLEDCASFSLSPEREELFWANYDIPQSTDADDVKLENVSVSQAYYPPIDGTYDYVGTTDGEAYFDFTFTSKPVIATITFLLYNDNNGNGQFDKGEIVVTSTDSLMEQTGRISFGTDVYAYTDYEVFVTAY